LPGLVTVAHVRDISGGDGAGRVGEGRLRAVGQHHGAMVQQAQPALPSQVQRIAVGQPHGTAAQDCTKAMDSYIIIYYIYTHKYIFSGRGVACCPVNIIVTYSPNAIIVMIVLHKK